VDDPLRDRRAFRRSTRTKLAEESLPARACLAVLAAAPPSAATQFQVRASWDVASTGVTRLRLSQSSELLAERSIVPPGRKPQNCPGAGSRPPPAGHRTLSRSQGVPLGAPLIGEGERNIYLSMAFVKRSGVRFPLGVGTWNSSRST
jgi:hypothetical protein